MPRIFTSATYVYKKHAASICTIRKCVYASH